MQESFAPYKDSIDCNKESRSPNKESITNSLTFDFKNDIKKLEEIYKLKETNNFETMNIQMIKINEYRQSFSKFMRRLIKSITF